MKNDVNNSEVLKLAILVLSKYLLHITFWSYRNKSWQPIITKGLSVPKFDLKRRRQCEELLPKTT